MFKFFKNLFHKPEIQPVAPVARAVAVAEPAVPVVKVETAALSLAAIIERFPAELKEIVVKMPGPDVMVVLPVSIILKQLPTGVVKMSLASITRQAPSGTFNTVRTEEKQMVDIPLSEVLTRMRPDLLKRRSDQRVHDLAKGDVVDVFGNPLKGIAPAVPAAVAAEAPAAAVAAPVLKMPKPDRVLTMPQAEPAAAPAPAPAPAVRAPDAMPAPMRLAPAPGMGAALGGAEKKPKGPLPVAPLKSPAAPVALKAAAPSPAQPAAESSDTANQTPLLLNLADVSAGWPADVLEEIAAHAGADAKLSLPLGEVSAGLQKGKVIFTWGRIRSWISPVILTAPQAAETLELQLPLRVVAPLFMKASKPEAPRKKLVVDESIPALFAGGTEKKPAAAPEAPAPAPEAAAPEPAAPEPAAPEAAAPEPAAPEAAAPEAAAPEAAAPEAAAPEAAAPEAAAPEAAAPEAAGSEEAATDTTAETVAPEAVSAEPAAKEPEPEPLKLATAEPQQPATPAVAPEPAQELAENLGAIFGLPDQNVWSPVEIVEHIKRIPTVAGALVALKEGLVVAHSLPEPMKGEVVAAFLPQIFSRLNKYSDEMSLGEVNELLMSTHGAYLQLFRLGTVFFAVLSKEGATLPSKQIRFIATELATQAQ